MVREHNGEVGAALVSEDADAAKGDEDVGEVAKVVGVEDEAEVVHAKAENGEA